MSDQDAVIGDREIADLSIDELDALIARRDAMRAEAAAEPARRDHDGGATRYRLRRKRLLLPPKIGRPRKVKGGATPAPQGGGATPPARQRRGAKQQLGGLGAWHRVADGPTLTGCKAHRALDLDRFRELAELGLSLPQVAAAMGFTYTTLKKRLLDNELLQQIWDSGHANLIEVCARTMRDAAAAGNLQAAAFILRAKGFFEKSESQVEVSVNIGSQPASITSAHAEQLLAEHRKYVAGPVIEGTKAEPGDGEAQTRNSGEGETEPGE